MPATAVAPPPPARPSPVSAFLVLIAFSFRRQWRIRQMGWVALGLLAVLAGTVAVMTYGPTGWGLLNRYSWRYQTTMKDFPQQLDQVQALPLPSDATGMQLLATAPFRAILVDPIFLNDWAFLSFSRWVVFTMHLGFLMPLFTLAFASAAIGSEREGRTLIWLLTRPLPRWAVYLAKFLGVLPWSVVASCGGFVVLCLAGGPYGARALVTYWPAILAGTIAFSALFHLVGTLFRRPAVVGLVYVFFFEMLVANLPGSLKQLSLNYYTRSLLYNEATGAVVAVAPDSLDVYAPAGPVTSWATLLGAAVVFTVVGMYLFGRQEPKDET
ncbi:ABC transporter permease subunit [Fimbriiglobus ruber]|uniref:Putative integral membrane protein n=1 Tax=Fimbriiglobus ruber TaxID=1908690 RepID=A0A225DV19_9BACT|nr:ABC transporter permease subunit [Fimbriiglobus ruber]OWK45370.1 putative integral membrane protein [Fimbriiglobus ruber]